MNMNWLESILYGLISGISEFLPISSRAHQQIAMLLFGVEKPDPVRNFGIHISLIFSLLYTCKPLFEQLQYARNQRSSRNGYQFSSHYRQDWRFARSATIPMLIVLIAFSYIFRSGEGNLLITSGFLLLNGILLFIPGQMLQGNKKAGGMSQLDGVMIGAFGGLGAISGISRVGCLTGLSVARGADRQHAFNWALILCIPALVVLSFLDILQMFTAGPIPFWKSFITYLLSGIGAFAGGYGGLKLARVTMAQAGFSGFSYYCWGVSLLSFLLYLFAV